MHIQNSHISSKYSLFGGGLLLTISLVALGVFLTGYLTGTFQFSPILFALPGGTSLLAFTIIAISGVLLFLDSSSDRIITPLPEPYASPPIARVKKRDDANIKSDVFPKEESLVSYKTQVHKIVMGENTTPLYEKICAHWVRNAAFRIFHNPLRSFLELVVNALDAREPDHPIGKFGLGFLSIMSFLIHEETRGCRIQITTTNLSSEGLFSYKIDIFQKDGVIQTHFTKLKTLSKTGTTITITPNQGTFSADTLQQIKSILYYLQFYSWGKIEITEPSALTTLGSGEEVYARVTLHPKELSVEDEGCGISLATASSEFFDSRI